MKARMIMIAAALAALTLLSAGCKKHQWRPEPGTPIKFRAVSNVNSKPLDTRTVYAGQYFTVGEGSDAKKFEHIDWVVGDKISIGYVSAPASGLVAEYSNYDIISATQPDREVDPSAKSNATLAPSGGNGLVWRDGSMHVFKAMYPTVPDDERFRFDVENGEVVYNVPCLYPIEPVLIRDGETNTYVEDMKYAWMLSRGDAPVQAGGTINLLFEMHFTAFQITFDSANASSLLINSVSLSDANEPIVGDFIYSEDMAHITTDVDGNEVSKKVTAFFNEAHTPITLTKGNPVTVVIFTSCAHTKQAMTLSFSIQNGAETVDRSIKLATATANLEPGADGKFNYGITFTNPYKHVITGIEIPMTIPEDSAWFEAASAGGYENQDWED